MTDDFDLGALLIKENARRTAILDQNAHGELDNAAEGGYFANDQIWTAEEVAHDLKMYSVSFRSSKWDVPENMLVLTASCQRWLDARSVRS